MRISSALLIVVKTFHAKFLLVERKSTTGLFGFRKFWELLLFFVLLFPKIFMKCSFISPNFKVRFNNRDKIVLFTSIWDTRHYNSLFSTIQSNVGSLMSLNNYWCLRLLELHGSSGMKRMYFVYCISISSFKMFRFDCRIGRKTFISFVIKGLEWPFVYIKVLYNIRFMPKLLNLTYVLI